MAKLHALRIGVAAVFGLLARVIGLDARLRHAKRLESLSVAGAERGVEFGIRDPQGCGRQRHVVEAFRQLNDCLVAAGADIRDDLRHGIVDVDRRFALGSEERFKGPGKIRRRSI